MPLSKAKKKKLDAVVHDLFNGITEDDVLHVQGRQMFIGKSALTAEARKEVIEGAKIIRNLPVWHALMNEMKLVSNKRMFDYAETTDDLVFGKAMLYSLSVLEKKIEKLASMPI